MAKPLVTRTVSVLRDRIGPKKFRLSVVIWNASRATTTTVFKVTGTKAFVEKVFRQSEAAKFAEI
jgi:hypothetical protein